MSEPTKMCSRHRSPWPCQVNNSECKLETNARLIKALYKVYKAMGIER